VKEDLSRYLKEAAAREIIITRHGKPAGVLIGFESEDDWPENDPRFLQHDCLCPTDPRGVSG
jgi:prevent-host-death family protein